MNILSDFKKIGIFLGKQVKSTLHMVLYLHKTEKKVLESNQETKPKKALKTKAKQKKDEPTLSSKKDKVKTDVPPLDILQDVPKTPASFVEKIRNLRHSRIIMGCIIFFLSILIILMFWLILDRLLPAPISEETQSEPILSSSEEKNDDKPLSQSNSKESSSNTHISEVIKEKEAEKEETTDRNVTPEEGVVSSGAENQEKPEENIPVEIAPVTYQPYVDLEKDQGIIRTINPQFFMQTPPLNADGKPTNLSPKVSIILYNVGMSFFEMDTLLAELPDEMSIAITPYVDDYDYILRDMKELGYDVLIQMPWEDEKVSTDQGYLTILTGLGQEEMSERLMKYKHLISRSDGVFAEGGGNFVRSPNDLETVLKYILSVKNALVAPPDVLMSRLHEKASETKINYVSTTLVDPDIKNLKAIASLSQRTGYAVLAFESNLNVVPVINEWIDKLEELGIDIVPITKILNPSGKKE